jgi:hypothetical protein
MLGNKETREVIVSPKWKIVTEDLKDLVSDFLWGASAFGLTLLLEYLNNIDLEVLVGIENTAYAGLVVGFLTTFISRVLKKVRKESNYPLNKK